MAYSFGVDADPGVVFDGGAEVVGASWIREGDALGAI